MNLMGCDKIEIQKLREGLKKVEFSHKGGEGAHWAPKSDLRRKFQNNFGNVGVNFLVSDGIK